MTRRRVAPWSVGIGTLAVAAIAASQTELAAPMPGSEKAVPGAESVETVLRVTCALPAGRGQALAEFLAAHAVAGIDVRPAAGGDPNRMTVVASEDAQKALGTFIEKCVRKEPTAASPGPVPQYDDFGAAGAGPEESSSLGEGFQPPSTDTLGASPFIEES